MTELNEVVLTGVITKVYPTVTTPSGVNVARLMLEHNSQQIEANELRQVKCKVYCLFVKQEIGEDKIGESIKLTGFLATNKDNQLVLHAKQIKFLSEKDL